MTIVRTSLLGLFFALGVYAAPAGALENDVKWVSSKGSDSEDCSASRPCRTFMIAQERAPHGGIIMCQDSGDFSDSNNSFGFWVMKSITIDCTGHSAKLRGVFMHGRGCPTCFVEGPFVFPDGPAFVTILRGLNIYGGLSSDLSVAFTVGAGLHIENCTITGFANSSTNIPAIGIHFAPTGASRLHVTNSVISWNGNTLGEPKNFGGGIVVKPTGSSVARVILTGVQVQSNSVGLLVDGTAGTGVITMSVTDSSFGGNLREGILTVSEKGKAVVNILLDRTRSVNNFTFGIRAIGGGVTVRAAHSSVHGNNTGVDSSSGAMILSAGKTNIVEGNKVDGAFSGSFALK